MRFREHGKALRAALLGCAVLTAVAAPPRRAAGQNPPSEGAQKPPESGKTIQVQVALVNLFATVRDNHHEIIGNLTKDDFKVLEDNQAQQVAFFSKEVTMPVTLGLMVDTSGSQSDLLGLEQVAASSFLHRVIRKGDLAMVISFDVDVDLLADFTDDTEILERAVQRTRINAPSSQGPVARNDVRGTALYDAIYVACNDQLSGQAGRKALVILTDGEDVGSKVSLKDAIEAAQRADTVVHVILISDPRSYFAMGMTYGGAGVAKKLAEETGGRMIDANGGKKLDEAFDQISEELRSQYVLGYYPTNAAHDGTFRKIKVETTRAGSKVLARRGYYAPAK